MREGRVKIETYEGVDVFVELEVGEFCAWYKTAWYRDRSLPALRGILDSRIRNRAFKWEKLLLVRDEHGFSDIQRALRSLTVRGRFAADEEGRVFEARSVEDVQELAGAFEPSSAKSFFADKAEGVLWSKDRNEALIRSSYADQVWTWFDNNRGLSYIGALEKWETAWKQK